MCDLLPNSLSHRSGSRHHRLPGLALAAALLTGISVVRAQATRFRVAGEHGRAAVRIEPDEAAETVARLAFGAEVDAAGAPPAADAAWVRIRAPEDVSLWIYAELVRNGRVAVNRALVRTGAGLAYKAVAGVAIGTPIESRGSLGDWMKIAPPPGTAFWIARSDVEPIAQEEADAPAAPPSNGAAADQASPPDDPGRPADSPAFPEELDGFARAPSRPQGTRVARTGRLDWPSHWDRKSPPVCSCRLLSGDDTPAVLILDRTGRAASLVGAKVQADGTLWFLEGLPDPVLLVETLALL